MNINKFEKANKIYEAIKKIDAEIIELDKLALLIVNNEVNVSFDFKVENLTNIKEKEDEVSFDEDGSLQVNNTSSLFDIYKSSLMSYISTPKPIENKNIQTLKNEISVNTSLNILGMLLSDKNHKRTNLLDKLNKIGVQI